MFILLWAFFVILNMKLNLEIAVTGIVVALIAEAAGVFFLGWNLKKEIAFLKRIPRAIGYAFMLLWEIFKANLAVMKIIYSKKEIKPASVTIPRRSKTEWKTVLEANSITLTPGTVTMHLTPDSLIVHCLDESMAEGLEGSVFEKGIEKLGGEK